MSYLQESNRPYYDDRTTSDLWRRESEFHGMEFAREEERERCGKAYVYDHTPAPVEAPSGGLSFVEFCAEVATERDAWWPKWKKEHGL
jgi:hypothetical protein